MNKGVKAKLAKHYSDFVGYEHNGKSVNVESWEGDLELLFLDNMTSMKGLPKHVSGNFRIMGTSIQTLEYSPQFVEGGKVSYNFNRLLSVEGCLKSPNLDFSHNKSLKTLDGLNKTNPEMRWLIASNCAIKDYKGLPSRYEFNLELSNNELTTVEGLPEYIGQSLMLSGNKIENLKDIHRFVKHCKHLYLRNNPLKSHLGGLLKIEGLEKVFFPEHLKFAEDIVNKFLSKPNRDAADSLRIMKELKLAAPKDLDTRKIGMC